MVANLSSHKAGWDDRWQEFSDWSVKGQQIKDDLLFLVDEDTNAFNKVMDAFALPKDVTKGDWAKSKWMDTEWVKWRAQWQPAARGRLRAPLRPR